MNKATEDLISLLKDIIDRWKAKGDKFDYFRIPLIELLSSMENGSFMERSIEEQKGELFGIRGQYTGKGEVLRMMISDREEYTVYQNALRQIIGSYVDSISQDKSDL